MAANFFKDIINPKFGQIAPLDISDNGKVLIISDFHMGNGSRTDDLNKNAELLTEILEDYYLPNDYHLILNGDIEELQRFSLSAVKSRWKNLYAVFDRFAEKNKLYKNLGNHDESLIFERKYPYKLYNAVHIKTGVLPIYVYHGHQSSKMYDKYNNLISLGIRYFLKPFGIKNISAARSPHKRFYVEKEAYKFSMENNCVSIIGHTHRPLFESLGRFEYIKFEIERLCRDYPSAGEVKQEMIAKEVANLRYELGKLKRSERRDILRQSLYGDEFPVPCLFNSGSAIGNKGINAIELDNKNISLVYWYNEGEGKQFVGRGGYIITKIDNSSASRAVLNEDQLEYVEAKIRLLGNGNKIDSREQLTMSN
jgi:UDP-2,3-diacylglucosamine pyrophosphatase LpxH